MLVSGEEKDPFPELSAEHMLEFSLKVRCRHNPKAPKDSENPNELYLRSQGERGRGKGCGDLSGVCMV